MIIALGPCVICGTLFSFNPDRVPSYQGMPICRTCVEAANVERVALGQTPIVIFPDSYE